MGDVAMLSVAVERIHALWPSATLGVITNSPERLAAHCPQAVPITDKGWRLWFEGPYLGWGVHSRLPAPAARRLRSVERILRRRAPRIARLMIEARQRAKRTEDGSLDEFLDWVATADVAVVVGAGLLTDDFAPLAISVLELLETFVDRNAPVAMFGQGVGPIDSPELEECCRRVLPRLDLITLREELAGKPILDRMGVPDERVITTGDDAIELALRSGESETPGQAIGVSLRRARYSQVTDDVLAEVGALLRRVAERHGVPLVPVPISSYPKERDAEVIARSLGLPLEETQEPTSPESVISTIHRCRMVVTGSYHAGVFALAQGVPAVGLARSGYYSNKFLGLSDQFGGRCSMVALDEPDALDRLEHEIDVAWNRPREFRADLLESARNQAALSRSAYERFRDRCERSAAPGQRSTA